MYLVVTIDTEEDNWGSYSTTNNPVTNIEKLVPLQKIFDEYGIRPTYLITYPVATNPRSIEILKRILGDGKCEIGMHCHPWNTPPFEEEINEYNSMLCNLPEALVLQKLSVLHEAICENLGVIPVSFRAGRWGFSSTVAQALCQLGYRVDTSVSPFVDWAPYYGPDFSNFRNDPFRFNPDAIATSRGDGALIEIPATVGFLQKNFERCHRWTRSLETDFGKTLRLKGVLSRFGLLNKVWLSPELADADEMVKLSKLMRRMNFPCLNMSFHSTTLVAGLSPFVATKLGEEAFLKRIENFLIFGKDTLLKSVTLSQLPVE